MIAAATNYVAYPNANKAATELVDEDLRNDPGVYPPADVMTRLFIVEVDEGRQMRDLTRTWTRIKTGR